MTLKVMTEAPPEDVGGSSDENGPSHCDEQDLAVVELLKDQFGDYSDPQAYDWSWRETD